MRHLTLGGGFSKVVYLCQIKRLVVRQGPRMLTILPLLMVHSKEGVSHVWNSDRQFPKRLSPFSVCQQWFIGADERVQTKPTI